MSVMRYPDYLGSSLVSDFFSFSSSRSSASSGSLEQSHHIWVHVGLADSGECKERSLRLPIIGLVVAGIDLQNLLEKDRLQRLPYAVVWPLNDQRVGD